MKLFEKFFNRDNLKEIVNNLNINFVKKAGVEYYNAPCVFDIETSSFEDNGKKCGVMYIWQFGINGYCFYGRNWTEFFDFIEELENILCLNKNKRIIIYVHNLQFEFQFIKKFFNWLDTLIIEDRRVLKAISNEGLEFRDSYILTGLSLEKSAEELTKYKLNKKVGDLDYSKIRFEKTELSEKELDYCLYDILVLMAIIEEKREQEKNDISKIPLTKTGYVRRYVKNKCLSKGKQFKEYNDFIKNLTIEEDEYMLLKQASGGGFTHCNCNYVNIINKNIRSFDLNSAYPSILISKKFPISKGYKIEPKTEEEFKDLLKNFCCVFSITFYNLTSAVDFEHYISVSKCRNTKELLEDNGRVVEAKQLTISITGEALEIIDMFYNYEEYRINKMYVYYKEYLPTPFVKCILDFYEKKTELKGVKGKEEEYLLNKGMLNSFYGLCIEDIVRDRKTFNSLNEKYETEEEDMKEQLNKYNKKNGRFCSYSWGVFCSSYCQLAILKTIYNIKDDYIYSDTDSVKIKNYEKHLDYFEKYNNKITEEIKNALKFHGINEEKALPKTKDGKVKPLGIFECDGIYKRFKTLKAKCYILEDEKNNISLTVSGLGKEAIDYLKEKYDNPFKAFKSGLTVPKNRSGKKCVYYIEEARKGIYEDYKGNKCDYYEESGACIENVDFEFSQSEGFINFLSNLFFSIEDK